MVLSSDGHYRDNLRNLSAEVAPAARWGWRWRLRYDGTRHGLFDSEDHVADPWHWARTHEVAERRAIRALERVRRMAQIEVLEP